MQVTVLQGVAVCVYMFTVINEYMLKLLVFLHDAALSALQGVIVVCTCDFSTLSTASAAVLTHSYFLDLVDS